MQDFGLLIDGMMPTSASWKALCAWLTEAHETRPDAFHAALPRAEALVRDWPHRLCVLPSEWEEAWFAGEALPYLSLARCVVCDNDHIDALVASPLLAGLRSLELEGIVCLEAILASDVLSSLEELHCSDWEHPCSVEIVETLRRHPVWQALVHLELSFEMEEAGWALLFSAPFAPRCQGLFLDEYCPREALSALAGLGVCQGLSSFGVNGFECSDETYDQLLRSLAGGAMERLALFGLEVFGERLQALLGCAMPRLKHLALHDHNPCPTDQDAIALAEAPLAGQLASLEVSTVEVGVDGLGALVESTQLALEVRDSFRRVWEYKKGELETGFAEVRSLLMSPRTGASWDRLLVMAQEYRRASRSSFEDVWRPYVLGHLASWPDEARTLEVEYREEEHPFSLAKCLDFSTFRLGDEEYHESSVTNLIEMLSFPCNVQASSVVLPDWHFRGGGSYLQRAIEAFVALPLYANLRKLECGGSLINEAAAAALAGAPHLRSLEYLALGDCYLKDKAPVFSLLINAPLTASLNELHLSSNHLTNDDLQAMVKSPYLSHLSSLSLDQNDIDAEGLSALLQSDIVDGIKALSLGGLRMGPEAPRLLAEAPLCVGLEKVSLFQGWMQDEGLDALLRAPWLPGCHTLDLASNGWELAAFQKLGAHEAMAGTRELAIGERFLDAEMLGALAASVHLGALETLIVEESFLEKEGMFQIFHGPHWKLRHLELTYPNIDAAAIATLNGSPAAAYLESFSIEGDETFDDEAAIALASIASLPALKKLALHDTEMDEEGVLALVRAPWFQQLALFSVPASVLDSDEVREALDEVALPAMHLVEKY